MASRTGLRPNREPISAHCPWLKDIFFRLVRCPHLWTMGTVVPVLCNASGNIGRKGEGHRIADLRALHTYLRHKTREDDE